MQKIYINKYFKKLMELFLWISGVALILEYAIPMGLQNFAASVKENMSGASTSSLSSTAGESVTVMDLASHGIVPIMLLFALIAYLFACYLAYKSPDQSAYIKTKTLYFLFPACFVFLLLGDLYAFLVLLALCFCAVQLLRKGKFNYCEEELSFRQKELHKMREELDAHDDYPIRDETMAEDDEAK